jgi:hypothetical protein
MNIKPWVGDLEKYHAFVTTSGIKHKSEVTQIMKT